MTAVGENAVEDAALSWFSELGYGVEHSPEIGPEGSRPERLSYDNVILGQRFRDTLNRLNPHLSRDALENVEATVRRMESPALIPENRRIHGLLAESVNVEITREDGSLATETARLLDFDDPANNDWLAVNQVTVVENQKNRRADVVVFVNGLPLAVLELKNPGGEHATLEAAFNQLQTYKTDIPSLFRTNVINVTSDGLEARVGSLTADLERFMPWRTTDGSDLAPKGSPELGTVIQGIFEPSRFLDLLRDFTVFGDTGSETAKIVAGYHQFHGVKKAVEKTVEASDPQGDGRVGVIWHTQGAGKSLLMAFYAGKIVKHPAMENPTLVVLTDRNDLDGQLFGTFSMCKDLIRQTPYQAESRADLQEALNRQAGGVIFTTIQKFAPTSEQDHVPVLTDRRNVVVIADEAHRSQYGFSAKFSDATGEVSYGFAKYLRDALPNASFIGFTGTPIEQEDKNTPAVFGTYIDVYDISRAVEDGVTVPIYYESRLARIQLPEDKKPEIDAEIEALTEQDPEDQRERQKRKWAQTEALVGAEERLRLVAQDIVDHFEARITGLDGKALVVCMSRRICVALYNEIVKLRPDWHSDSDDGGAIKVVMTGAASDPSDFQPHVRNKAGRDYIANRMKDPSDPLKMVLVRDMWLTGFDVPCLHTMYVDKPMKGHGLMQAIARVNRVFRNKPAGLVVDYIGIAQNLKNALGQYSKKDQQYAGVDEAEAVELLQEKYEVVSSMFHGFDYSLALTGTSQQRLQVMGQAIEWILQKQQEWAAQETSEEGKKRARRRFNDEVLALSKAYALASATDKARELRDEIGFFQAIRAALVKSTSSGSKTDAERDLAVQQIVSRSVASTDIVDIMEAAGISRPDISILSDDFLAEIQQTKQKNLALEALRKLVNDQIRSRSKTNVVESKRFSERLDEAIARYHSNAVTTAEVLQELIDMAKEIRAAQERGAEEGLDPDEVAFYDALADNESAVEVMGNDQLKVIAQELLNQVKKNVTVDWAHREGARAQMRVLVKRILRKYGYPPDLQDAAVQTVLQQAEVVTAKWAA
ncbi:DEAD/DEAH box helicase [Rhodovibrio sodomensis]|uniref:Type I restriction enzyme endonuclease subunit n=1 Tax=Rhodovibrio sodomensis TaxID=1088 RepID=A0ABS1DIK3_9PROT|nr:type I restriction endonuclease subunit R [Rhodovibrio sodomensis]MBK1670019.1 DEAD/DEAH box helicase [Rhodovibrio sodomensis]